MSTYNTAAAAAATTARQAGGEGVDQQAAAGNNSINIPSIQNIISTANLGCKLDLKDLALHARNVEYNPRRFSAVIMRIQLPKTTALIFSTGKLVCTGAKSAEQSRRAVEKFARIVAKLGNLVDLKGFKIHNIVGASAMSFPIRLESLALATHKLSNYEPELFPGLIYRMEEPKITLLVFVSGKVVLTGAKSENEIYEAFLKIHPILTNFKKLHQ